MTRVDDLRACRPTASESELLAAAVDEIVRELALAPPIDPAGVASHLGISAVEVVDGLAFSSGLMLRDGELVIQVRAGESPQRRRFTTAHEIMHALVTDVRATGEAFRCEPVAMPEQRDDLESRCDQGAVDLLVPRLPLAVALERAPFGMSTVIDLWNRHETGLEPLMAQLVRAAPGALLVLRLDRMPDPSGATGGNLHVRWARSTGGAPDVAAGASLDADHPLNAVLEEGAFDGLCSLSGLVTDGPSSMFEVSAQLHAYTDVMGNAFDRVLAVARPAAG